MLRGCREKAKLFFLNCEESRALAFQKETLNTKGLSADYRDELMGSGAALKPKEGGEQSQSYCKLCAAAGSCAGTTLTAGSQTRGARLDQTRFRRRLRARQRPARMLLTDPAQAPGGGFRFVAGLFPPTARHLPLPSQAATFGGSKASFGAFVK